MCNVSPAYIKMYRIDIHILNLLNFVKPAIFVSIKRFRYMNDDDRIFHVLFIILNLINYDFFLLMYRNRNHYLHSLTPSGFLVLCKHLILHPPDMILRIRQYPPV